MKAVVMAAGKSTRTYPLTLTRPKPTLPLLGKPLLAHTLAALAGKVEEAVVVVGYRAEMVRTTFGASWEGLRLSYVEQREMRGTADALAAAGAAAGAEFLVLNGDDYYGGANVDALLRITGAAILGAPVRESSRYGVLEVEGGRLVGLTEKPAAGGPALVNTGVYKLEAAIFDYIDKLAPSSRGELELTDAVRAYARERGVAAVAAAGPWLAIATATDLLRAQVLLWPDAAPYRAGAGLILGEDAAVGGRSCLGANVNVGARALVEGSLLLDGVAVGEGAALTGSILGESVRIGAGAVVDGAVVGDGALIGAGAVVEAGARIWPGVEVAAGEFAAGEIKNEETPGGV